jgi:hypothetical protein
MKRNAKAIIANLYESKDHKLYTRKDCIIQFPKRFIDRGMGEIGAENHIFGIYAIIMGDEYAVSAVPSMIKTAPHQISQIDIGEVPYYNFHYAAGSAIMENTHLVKKETLVYSVMEEFFLKGNVPWYINYEDLGKIFDKAKYYTGSNVAQNYAILESLAAYVSRSAKKRSVQYRHVIKKREDLITPPEYIGIYGNVFYAAPGTVGKLAGSYFQDGVVSALTQPNTQSSHVEQLLRS